MCASGGCLVTRSVTTRTPSCPTRPIRAGRPFLRPRERGAASRRAETGACRRLRAWPPRGAAPPGRAGTGEGPRRRGARRRHAPLAAWRRATSRQSSTRSRRHRRVLHDCGLVVGGTVTRCLRHRRMLHHRGLVVGRTVTRCLGSAQHSPGRPPGASYREGRHEESSGSARRGPKTCRWSDEDCGQRRGRGPRRGALGRALRPRPGTL